MAPETVEGQYSTMNSPWNSRVQDSSSVQFIYCEHERMNEYFIHQHRYNTVKTVKSRTVSSDRAMRLVSSNLANYHATVQKLLIRQVLAKSLV